MRRNTTFILTLGLLVLPMQADEALKAPVQGSNIEQIDFAPGGVIQVNGSYDDLYIEGWDRSQVEISTTKFLPFEDKPEPSERASQRLDRIAVKAERHSAGELELSIDVPRRSIRLPFVSRTVTGGVRLECHLRVPRDSRLMIHHRVGLVSIHGVTGDVDARCHRGDIVLWLPEAAVYSIDARAKLGKVSSDFAGASRSEFLVGQKFVNGHPAASQRIYLRTGFGGITLKPILPESEAKNTPSAIAK